MPPPARSRRRRSTTCDDADVELRPALPNLDGVAIDQLLMAWGDGGLWQDIEQLAARFWLAEERNRSISWHHLVMAVGNFKRPRGRRLRPNLGASLADHGHTERGAFIVPGTDPGVVVAPGEPDTWEALSRALSGSAVATTTTLLAALWSEAHFVFDWRVRAAATALRISAGLDPGDVDPDSCASPPVTFADYIRIRVWLLDTAAVEGRRPAEVERALYSLSQQVGPSNRSRTWRSYAKDINARLVQIRAS